MKNKKLFKYLFLFGFIFSTIIPSTNVIAQSEPEQWWQSLPIYPTLTERHRDIYQQGILSGNDPTYFAVFGDCQTLTGRFMGVYYDMEEYHFPENSKNLKETVAYFREKSIVYNTPGNMDGASPAAQIAPGRPADYIEAGVCFENESAVQCELRAYKPSIAFIRLGTHWGERDSLYLRQLVESLLEANVLPILGTKAGNHEGDHSINNEIATIAQEYDIPLWNMWAAMEGLPNHGLDPDSVGGYMHLSEAGNEVQRYTALQILDSVWRYVR